MKTAIFGAYKTGTTALFYLQRDASGPLTRTLFEAPRYEPQVLDGVRGVLAKVIVKGPDGGVDYASFTSFDRKIFLVRDPRDWLVSSLLFMIQELPDLYTDDRRLHAILTMLREKEADPTSLSTKDLLERLTGMLTGLDLKAATDWIRTHVETLIDFERDLGPHFTLRYEDMVDGRLRSLEAYTGRELFWPPTIDRAHAHVPRTRSHGSWRHWFLEEDAAYFGPIFEAYLRRYGYPETYDLAREPFIDARHCSEYVQRTVGLRKAGRTS